MTEYLNWDEKVDKVSKKVVKFCEEKFIDDWWNDLLPKQRADIYRMFMGDDPITNWKEL